MTIEISRLREAIRKKYRQLWNGEADTELLLNKQYRPILKELSKIPATASASVKVEKEEPAAEIPTTPMHNYPSSQYTEVIAETPDAPPSVTDVLSTPQEQRYLLKMFKDDKRSIDNTYGPRIVNDMLMDSIALRYSQRDSSVLKGRKSILNETNSFLKETKSFLEETSSLETDVENVFVPQAPSVEEFFVGKTSLQFKALYDPGLEAAFNYVPASPSPYDNNGVQKYLDLIKVLNIPVVKRFHNSLTKSSLDLQYYGLQQRQMRAMADALTLNDYVENVNLEDNVLDLDSMYHLGQMLRKNVCIRKLNLSGCMIGTEGAGMLGSGLDVCQCLEYLDLSHNALGDEGFEEISPSFGYNTSVRTLILSHNNLTHKSGYNLGELLGENTSIENLDLSWNQMSLEPGLKKFLSTAGSQNTTLLSLNMSWNGLQGEKIAGFFKLFLTKHKGIQVLDISNNRFEQVGEMTKLARGVSLSETLRELHMGFNPIKEAEAFALLSGISSASPLRYLNLDYIWVNKEFDQLGKQAEQSRGLRIKVGGVYEGKDIKGPDMQKCLLQRAHYLGLKPKKKKNKKDYGWFLLRLRDTDKLKPVKKSKFEEMVIQDKIKFEEGLVDELAKKFRNEKKRIDLPHMLDVYLELYPKTKLPRPKSRKKKGKKTHSKVEQEIAVVNLENQTEGVVVLENETQNKTDEQVTVENKEDEQMLVEKQDVQIGDEKKADGHIEVEEKTDEHLGVEEKTDEQVGVGEKADEPEGVGKKMDEQVGVEKKADELVGVEGKEDELAEVEKVADEQ